MIIGISGYAGSGKDTAGRIIQCFTAKYTTEEVVLSVTKGGDYNLLPFSDETNWQIKKWADPLRKVTAIMLGMDVNFLYTDEFKSMYLPSCWNYIRQTFECDEHNRDGFTEASMTGREFLQKLGTDAVRNGLHENAWVNALMADYTWVDSKYYQHKDGTPIKTTDLPNWILTDTRFPNELAAVKERGGISIRINRPWQMPQWLDEVPKPTIEKHPSETSLDTAEFDYVIDNNGTIEELVHKLKAILIERQLIK